MFFTAHNKGLATKSAERKDRKNTAGQLFCMYCVRTVNLD